MITVLHRGGYAQMITILQRGGGSLGTPKSNYVLCARPLTWFTFFDFSKKTIDKVPEITMEAPSSTILKYTHIHLLY